jgi:hypothetical protein
MDRHAEHHESHAQDVCGAGDLRQHRQGHGRGGGRQQRQQQREARPRQAGHGELVADIGYYRGGDADPDASGEQLDRLERAQRLDQPDRHHEEPRHGHGRAQDLDPAGRALRGNPMTKHDVGDEQQAVDGRPDQAQRIARPPHVDEHHDARDRACQGRAVAPGAQAV